MAEGIQFVPVLSFLAFKDPVASKQSSHGLCQGIGGYLATTPTAATHAAMVDTAREVAGQGAWFAHLGASTLDPTRTNCPRPLTEEFPYGGATSDCYWRWNQGRWRELPDDASRRFYTPGLGITFFIGNYYDLNASDVGLVHGFISHFENNREGLTPADHRPNCLLGNDLLVVGSEKGVEWSDNLDVGGYSYAGYNYSNVVSGCGWNTAAREATKDEFLAVCEIQVPTPLFSEIEKHVTSPTDKWWIPYFIVSFLVCLILFIIVWRCQDREDEDEPLDEVPEWVEMEAEGLMRSKSFVSQRAIECPKGKEQFMPCTNASGRWVTSQLSTRNICPPVCMAEFTPNENPPVTDFTNVHIFDRDGNNVE
ncbi:unnamed protein product [Phytomonas sp. Hart1]|nr:unnamed protein product [Phytomonas sp. Hart1]|eukprot:CCW66773.1 unnamed protein product [Phytomonas sp. isolate Hart1]